MQKRGLFPKSNLISIQITVSKSKFTIDGDCERPADRFPSRRAADRAHTTAAFVTRLTRHRSSKLSHIPCSISDMRCPELQINRGRQVITVLSTLHNNINLAGFETSAAIEYSISAQSHGVVLNVFRKSNRPAARDCGEL